MYFFLDMGIGENFSLSSLDLFSGLWSLMGFGSALPQMRLLITLIKLRRQGCHQCLMWILIKFFCIKFDNFTTNLLTFCCKFAENQFAYESVSMVKTSKHMYAHICERVLCSTVAAISGWVGLLWVDLLVGC